MVRKHTDDRGPTVKRPTVKRFTVSLEVEDYERLRALAEGHRPRLTLQYVIQYAVHLLLERAEDPQFVLRLGDPVHRKETNA